MSSSSKTCVCDNESPKRVDCEGCGDVLHYQWCSDPRRVYARDDYGNNYCAACTGAAEKAALA